MDDLTIFARATGAGRAGIAVIRISGPATRAGLHAVLAHPGGAGSGDAVPPPRRAALRRVIDPGTGDLIDDGLVLWFPGPGSFTGEDMAELHVHGGHAVVEEVLRALGRLPGFRTAEPGEFSRRAFVNGRIDLTQAEAIADLVDAETEAQRRQAQRQMAGGLGRVYEGWRQDLIRAMSRLEAAIDFSDEDLPRDVSDEARTIVARLIAEAEAHLSAGHRGERLRSGVQVALIGPPNVGKSTLLNRLAGRDAAIVSATAGTTRDVVEVHLNLDGYPVVMADTAGLRNGGDEIELEGMRRAVRRAEDADLVVGVLEAAERMTVPDAIRARLTVDALIVINKIDRLSGPPGEVLASDGTAAYPISAKTGAGFEQFLGGLTARVAALAGGPTGDPVLTRARHREAVEAAVRHLRAVQQGGYECGAELMAEDIRLAARAIGRITGRIGVEDILDVVFADFCIGK
ncbi:MAG: tRNA uridine-5-carboxymethylaminomethyl(34) synthesis GTPase MnmE [Rhodospirillaceae bacterium]